MINVQKDTQQVPFYLLRRRSKAAAAEKGGQRDQSFMYEMETEG